MDETLASSQPFRVFVLELVSSGYFGDDIGESFRAEGRAMLDAVLADFRRIPGIAVETIVNDLDELRRAFNRPADVTLCIAPEFDDLLWRFTEFICRPWMRSLNCDSQTMRLCGDKWWFADHLKEHGIPTMATARLELGRRPWTFPCVAKPRFGAGSWLVRRVDNRREWDAVSEEYRAAGLTEILHQPLVKGQSCSIAALVRPDVPPDLLPIAAQRLSGEGKFAYLGGDLPADLPAQSADAVRKLFERTLESMEGLNGYIGCDVIVPDKHPDRPVIVELNPRLTTSYIGYRQLCADNLMERLLFPDRLQEPLRWKPGTVSFEANGGMLESRIGL
jgi:tyramine---L-glutamate ligase